VDVDLLTGTAVVNIPLFKIGHGDVAVPATLAYQATGIKVEDSAQSVGLGWHLQLEASITRVVKGFPDDCEYQGDLTYPVIKGWLRTTDIATKVENFTIANDNNAATCNDEFTDYAYMNSNFSYNDDTEPDIFQVSVPGLSFQFVFDKDKNIRVIPYKDVRITYVTDADGRITSFTVTDDKGVKYVFDQAVHAKIRIDENIDPATLDAFKRNYMMYRLGSSGYTFYYNYKWYVSTISDTKGNSVKYGYDEAEIRPGNGTMEKVELIKYNPSGASFYKQMLYSTYGSYYGKLLTAIWYGNDDILTQFVELEWETDRLKRINLLQEGKIIGFEYTSRFNANNSESEWGRFFLNRLWKSSFGCGTDWAYRFTYYDVDENANTCYSTTNANFNNAQDYWGYYNGAAQNADLVPPIWVYPDNPAVDKFKITPIPGYTGNVVLLPGVNRTPSASAIAGSLYRITYPQGAITQLEYENNDYFDKDVNGTVTGGGIRIKKITHNDGLNTNDVTIYEYNDPVTGITSGRATAIPSFTLAFFNNNSFPDETDAVKNSSYRTSYDFSDEPKAILYSKVSVRKTGGGKSVHEFNTASSWGNPATGNWIETPVYYARQFSSNPPSCTPVAPDVFANGKHVYPFPANPNYDFERGLLQKVSQYNDLNVLIRQEEYAYQRSHTQPVVIKALKFDDIKGIRAYARYDVLSTVGNLLAARVIKKWDASNPVANVFTTETETYAYDATDHRLPTMYRMQNSDGKIFKVSMKYAKDYSTTGTGDQYEQALHSLVAKNNNVLTESWQSVVTNGIEKVVSSTLTAYKHFNPGGLSGMYLPCETWKFVSSDGITNFVPAVFNAGALTKHAGYFKTTSILAHDLAGNPVSVTDNTKVNKAYLYNTQLNLKTSEFVNAKHDEIIHSTFDYDGDFGNFYYTIGSVVEPGHNSYKCYSLQAGNPLTKTITNATTNKNIIFSCWLKEAAAAGNLTVTITPAGGNPASYTLAYTVHNGWKYYEISIPKPAYPTVLTYTVAFQSSSAVKIDDVLLYPDNAALKTYSYTLKTYGAIIGTKGVLLSAEGSNNGLVRQYEYDGRGRISIVRDQDENILELRNYKDANQWQDFASSTLTWTNPPVTTTPVTFSNGPTFSTCLLMGGYYKWNFGDGTPEVTTATNTATHTYTIGGKFQVTCTAYPSGSTPIVVTTPAVTAANAVTVPNPIPPPPQVSVTICAAGIVERTSAGQCVLANCTGLTAVCSNTKFKVSSITPGSPGDAEFYKWEKASLNSNNWSTISTSATATVNFTTFTSSYKVRCTVYTMWGAEGISNEIHVIRN
jgi:hypothetical protein